MQSITLELRPRLQTCNAFIRLCNESKIHDKDIRVKLSEESVIFLFREESIELLLKSIKIIPSSLSTLMVTNDWICFRVQTKSSAVYGSFGRELVRNFTLKTVRPTNQSESYELLKKESDCTIACSCCKNVITKNVCFERTLPLPDGDFDPNEWFCCKHQDFTANLSPRETDLLYGPFFVLVNQRIFNENAKLAERTIVCKRCLQRVGKIDGTNACKLWNCCVEYIRGTDRFLVKATSDPFHDFCASVLTSATGTFGEEIVLQTNIENETHFLVIKPMDWQLTLLTEPKNIVDSMNVISLEETKVVKVLYRYETNKNGTNIGGMNTKCSEVGLPIMEAGLKRLISSTKRYPQLHRLADNFYIGHINLDERAAET